MEGGRPLVTAVVGWVPRVEEGGWGWAQRAGMAAGGWAAVVRAVGGWGSVVVGKGLARQVGAVWDWEVWAAAERDWVVLEAEVDLASYVEEVGVASWKAEVDLASYVEEVGSVVF
ncbi:hypothetical protein ACKKBF_B09160 [Auxenochlorella protothecoides x Auxenochlorella symbiontica]